MASAAAAAAEAAKKAANEEAKIKARQAILDQLPNPQDKLRYLFQRIFVDDIKKDQKKDFDASVVERIIAQKQRLDKDFYTANWGKDGVFNQILTMKRKESDGGSLDDIAQWNNYDTFQNLVAGNSGNMTIVPSGQVYEYRVFPPYTAGEANLEAIHTFLGLPNFVRVVDTTNKGNKFIANYPVYQGANQRNCITPMTISCASDACGKTNLESGLKDLIGEKVGGQYPANSEKGKLIQNYAIEQFSTDVKNPSYIEFPAYEKRTKQKGRENLPALGTGLHDFMASRDLVIKCYGYENQARGTLDVKLFYENSKLKLTQVAENANIAGAFRKKFKDTIKKAFGLGDKDSIKEMIFLTKHNGDIAQVLDKFRTFNVIYPARTPVPAALSVEGLPRAFETYDMLPACKALLEGIDILIFHPFGTGTTEEEEAAEELPEAERPVIIVKKQGVGETSEQTASRLAAEYETLYTEIKGLYDDFSEKQTLFEAKEKFFQNQMNTFLDSVDKEIAAITEGSYDTQINEIYQKLITTLSKYSVVAEVFGSRREALPVFPAKYDPGQGTVQQRIEGFIEAKRALVDYKNNYLVVPRCFLDSNIIGGNNKDGPFVLKLELISLERETQFQEVVAESGVAAPKRKNGALMNFFNALNITFPSSDSLRQKTLTSKLTASAGMGVLMLVKKSMSKFATQMNRFATSILNLGNKKPEESLQRNVKNLLLATGFLRPTGEIISVGGRRKTRRFNDDENIRKRNSQTRTVNKGKQRQLTKKNIQNFVKLLKKQAKRYRNTQKAQKSPILIECIIPDTDIKTTIDLKEFIQFSKTLVKEIKRSFELFDTILKIDDDDPELKETAYNAVEQYIDQGNRPLATSVKKGGAPLSQAKKDEIITNYVGHRFPDPNITFNSIQRLTGSTVEDWEDFLELQGIIQERILSVEGKRRRYDDLNEFKYNCTYCPYKNERDLLQSLSSVLEVFRDFDNTSIRDLKTESNSTQDYFENCVCEFIDTERIKELQTGAFTKAQIEAEVKEVAQAQAAAAEPIQLENDEEEALKQYGEAVEEVGAAASSSLVSPTSSSVAASAAAQEYWLLENEGWFQLLPEQIKNEFRNLFKAEGSNAKALQYVKNQFETILNQPTFQSLPNLLKADAVAFFLNKLIEYGGNVGVSLGVWENQTKKLLKQISRNGIPTNGRNLEADYLALERAISAFYQKQAQAQLLSRSSSAGSENDQELKEIFEMTNSNDVQRPKTTYPTQTKKIRNNQRRGAKSAPPSTNTRRLAGQKRKTPEPERTEPERTESAKRRKTEVLAMKQKMFSLNSSIQQLIKEIQDLESFIQNPDLSVELYANPQEDLILAKKKLASLQEEYEQLRYQISQENQGENVPESTTSTSALSGVHRPTAFSRTIGVAPLGLTSSVLVAARPGTGAFRQTYPSYATAAAAEPGTGGVGRFGQGAFRQASSSTTAVPAENRDPNLEYDLLGRIIGQKLFNNDGKPFGYRNLYGQYHTY